MNRYSTFPTQCAAAGLPIPTMEYLFCEGRKWRFDFAWPRELVALEVEGGIWIRGRHNRGSGMLEDIQKYNEAAIRGWRLLRCTPDDMRSLKSVALIKEALKRMGYR
jgi:hypothetical protein